MLLDCERQLSELKKIRNRIYKQGVIRLIILFGGKIILIMNLNNF